MDDSHRFSIHCCDGIVEVEFSPAPPADYFEELSELLEPAEGYREIAAVLHAFAKVNELAVRIDLG